MELYFMKSFKAFYKKVHYDSANTSFSMRKRIHDKMKFLDTLYGNMYRH